jgi:ribokinase
MLSNQPVADRASARAALTALGAARRSVIITLGGEGLVGSEAGGEAFDLGALPVPIVSTHGAGDCFTGALSARLATGDDLQAACRFANEAAAHFVATRVPG